MLINKKAQYSQNHTLTLTNSTYVLNILVKIEFVNIFGPIIEAIL